MYVQLSTVDRSEASQLKGVVKCLYKGALPGYGRSYPMALNKYGIGMEDVLSVLNTATRRPQGILFHEGRMWELGANDQCSKRRNTRLCCGLTRQRVPRATSDVADVVIR